MGLIAKSPVGNNLRQTLRNEKTEFSNWIFNWNNDFIMFKC